MRRSKCNLWRRLNACLRVAASAKAGKDRKEIYAKAAGEILKTANSRNGARNARLNELFGQAFGIKLSHFNAFDVAYIASLSFPHPDSYRGQMKNHKDCRRKCTDLRQSAGI